MDNIYFEMSSFDVESAYASLKENGFIIIKNYFQNSELNNIKKRIKLLKNLIKEF